MEKGKIVQVMGPVVDVEFEDQNLPKYQRCLECRVTTAESLLWKWHSILGNHTVRCIMLASSDGLQQGYGGYCYRSRYFRTCRRRNSGSSF